MSDGDLLVPLRPRAGAEDPSAGAFDAARPLGIYVHFPFCSVHCPYCDFAVDARPEIPHEAYADAVVGEIQARAPWFRGGGAPPDLRSVYFGGGTPGLWRPDQLARTLQAARAAFDARSATPLEVTVEANPGEAAVAHLSALRSAGVNRLSLGAQSFDDAALTTIGRNHRADAIPTAFAAARRAGFANITCDLMFGLPGQSLDDWRHAIEALVALEPEHISCYALTIERGTAFGALDRAGRLPRPDDEAVATMFQVGRQALAAAGYAPYEVSSFARPGFRAVHNQLYWTQGAYLGVGVSASSFRPLTDGTGWRFSNPRGTDGYLRGAAESSWRPAKVERRSAAALENEALWLALRTSDGADRRIHQDRFGLDPLTPGDRQHQAQRCVNAGWLTIDHTHLRLTDEGFLFADEVAARLWRDDADAG